MALLRRAKPRLQRRGTNKCHIRGCQRVIERGERVCNRHKIEIEKTGKALPLKK